MRFLRVSASAKAPTQSYEGAAGYDFYSDEEVTLPSYDPVAFNTPIFSIDEYLEKLKKGELPYTQAKRIKTGIAIEVHIGHVGLFRDRSSYGAGSIIVTAGVIDSDYRGEVEVCLLNLSLFDIVIPAGSKIAQLLVMPVATTPPQEVMALSPTARGSKGFGSTGVS